MNKKSQNFGARFKYAFDNFMSKGGLSVFMALIALFISAIILMAIFRFIVNLIWPQETMANLTDQWWRAFLQIADGGSIAEDSDSNILNRIVGIISLFVGMVLFSSLVAFITSQFEAQLEKMRKGKSNVIENHHTLILGFGNRVLEIIRELIIANESEKSPVIVVLSENEKDEMDDFFRDRIENFKTTRIVTRSGSTSNVHLLRRVGISTCKSVIILNDAANDAPQKEKALADARVLKTILAVISCVGEKNLPSVVAELHLKSKQELAKTISDKIAIIDEHSILAKLMVQTSRISGLALVYDHIVGFNGNEFYFYRLPEGWGNKTYEEIIFHFPVCCVFGIRTAEGKILLNPERRTVLNDTDEVILLAEDDSTIKFSKLKVKANRPTNQPASPQPKLIEKQLIVGWSQKTATIIDEYSNYLIEGSGIDLVVTDVDEEMKSEFNGIQTRHPGIKMRIIKADTGNPDVLKKLQPEQYDNVIILSGDGGEAELMDSDTIAKLLEFRSYFKSLEKSEIKTQLITEIADSDNIEVIQEAGVNDFLISNQFVSKIYAQVSEEQDVLKVYEDLFSEAGCELYLKPVKLFLSGLVKDISFADLCAIALQRNETCLGVRLVAEEKNPETDYGIYINPPKNQLFRLNDNDFLITLAEDET